MTIPWLFLSCLRRSLVAPLAARHHHLTTVHVTPLRYAHSLFLGEVTNRVNERSGVTGTGHLTVVIQLQRVPLVGSFRS